MDLIGAVWRLEAVAMVNLKWPSENEIIPAMRGAIVEVDCGLGRNLPSGMGNRTRSNGFSFINITKVY